jgi:uncharacterized delta-60 repeat protein
LPAALGYSSSTGNRVLLRLLADGTVDREFAVQQQLDDFVNCVQPLADGTVLIGGDFGRYGTTRNVNLIRLNASAQLVTGFTPALTVPGTISSLALQADGKVLVAGRFWQINGLAAGNVARLTTAGALDPTFSLAGTDGAIHKLLVQANGRIALGGDFQAAGSHASPFVARLLADGAPDNAFATVATTIYYNSDIRALSEQPDGSLIVGGSRISFAGSAGSPSTLHHLLATGRADAAYANRVGSAAPNDFEIQDIASLPDGRHYVGGFFSVFNGAAAPGLFASGRWDPRQCLRADRSERYVQNFAAGHWASARCGLFLHDEGFHAWFA